MAAIIYLELELALPYRRIRPGFASSSIFFRTSSHPSCVCLLFVSYFAAWLIEYGPPIQG
jgi:hypothetical protein